MSSDYINNILERLQNIDDDLLKKDILKLIDERNQLLNRFNVDALTGAYNRWILRNVDDYSTVVLCDIDNFKMINDRYGHKTGDRILKDVTNLLISNCNYGDIVCRYGGDEFLIIFKNSDELLIKRKMEVIRDIIYSSNQIPNFKVSFSVGISKYEYDKSLDDAINEADKALYVSKSFGKNVITCYSDIENTNKVIKKIKEDDMMSASNY